MKALLPVIAGLLLLGWMATPVMAQVDETDDTDDGPVSISPVETTDDGSAVKKIVLARPFKLNEEYTYRWSKEKPKITEGYIVVLEVEKSYVRPRDVNVPVLYADTKPVEVTNVGFESGHRIVIVPGPVDLEKTTFYFGSVELPERVDADRGKKELESAKELGLKPFKKEDVRKALEVGGELVEVEDSYDLYLEVSDLILVYAPDEISRAETYRLPRVGS